MSSQVYLRKPENVGSNSVQITWHMPSFNDGPCSAFHVNLTSNDTHKSTIYEFNCSVTNVTIATKKYFTTFEVTVCSLTQPNAEGNGGGFSKPSSPEFFTTLPGGKLNLFNSNCHEVFCVTVLWMLENRFSIKP